MSPFAAQLDVLDSIPGIGLWTAHVIVAEIGTEMARFPTAAHLASWAGMCPGQHESAGKRTSGRTRHGSPWLRAALTEAAHSAGRTKQTYLGDRYRALVVRRGKKRAAIAVGRMILEICYELLTTGQIYDDQQRRAQTHPPLTETDRLVRRLQKLGHQVTLQPAA